MTSADGKGLAPGTKALGIIGIYGLFRGVAWSSFMYLYPLYVLNLGYSTADLGPMATYASLVSALILPIAGYLIDSGYAVLVAAVSGLCAAGSLVVPVLAPLFPSLVLGYALSNLAFVLWSPSRASLVASIAKPEILGRVFGAYALIYDVARIATPYIVGYFLLPSATYGSLMVGAGAMMLAATLGFAVAMSPLRTRASDEEILRGMWAPCASLRGLAKLKCVYSRTFALEKDLALLVVFAIFDGFAWRLWMPLLNAYLKEYAGLGDELIGLYNTLLGIGMLALSLPAGYLTDRLGALSALVAYESLAIVGVLDLALGRGLAVVYSAVLLGASISLWITSYNTITSVILGSKAVGKVRASIDATRVLTSVPAPLAGSAMLEALGATAPFAASAFLMLASIVPLLKCGRNLRRIETRQGG